MRTPLKWVTGIAVTLLVLAAIGRNSTPHTVSAPSVAATSQKSAPTVRVDGAHCTDSPSGSYIYTEGEVTNTSDTPLKRVQAVAVMRDASRRLVSSENAYIEFDPLMPGQSSPFKVMSRNDKTIMSCDVSMKQGLGGLLDATVNYSQ